MFKCKAVARKYDVGRESDEGPGWASEPGIPDPGMVASTFTLKNVVVTVLRYHPGPGISTIAESLEEDKLAELASPKNLDGDSLHKPREDCDIPQLVALRGPLVHVSLPCFP